MGLNMGYTYKQLKECAENIARDCGIEYGDAARVVGSWQGGAECGRAIAGDYGDVWRACDLLGIKYKKVKRKNAPVDRVKRDIKNGLINQGGADSVPETVTGDILPAGIGADGLPEGTAEKIENAIADYCARYNVEDMKKARQTTWKACCMYVGEKVFKPSKIIHDIERERVRGCTIYDVGRVARVVDLWAFLCMGYDKAPFIDDFATFCGVTETWLYGSASGDSLTPERMHLLKKLQGLQERGLAGLISDGRQNPTGALAILNHWHNWVQVREIVHTDAASSSAAVLPDFGAPPMLTEKP